MSKVYLKPIKSYSQTKEINIASLEFLENFIPLKVHFGEKGNKTFIEPKNFNKVFI